VAKLRIDISVQHPGWRGCQAVARRALSAAAAAEGKSGAVCLLLADDATLRALNKSWRGKDKPTNVLSFPAPEGHGDHLGDIALAAETVAAEAAEQGKAFHAHTAHLLVHGFLHLLGYDHEADDEAERMEARERAILSGLGFADPYAETRSP
jgi:probable rRNA maturation factor